MNENETLLDKAEANIRVALLILTQDYDDAMVNFAAYHVQQSYELMYKHILERNGIKYNFKHDIQQLLDSCISNNLIFPYNSYIADNADVITNMESKTRYIKNYSVSITTVKHAISAIRPLLETAKILNEAPSIQELHISDTCTDTLNVSDNIVRAKNLYPNENAKRFIALTSK